MDFFVSLGAKFEVASLLSVHARVSRVSLINSQFSGSEVGSYEPIDLIIRPTLCICKMMLVYSLIWAFVDDCLGA